MRTVSWWVVLGGIVTVAVACNGGGEENGGGTTEPTESTTTATAIPTRTTTLTTPTATSTTAVDLEAEVSAAYLAYWDAYAEALLELDPSLAEGFATGEELERIREEIGVLEADGVALRVVTDHNFSVVNLSEGMAVVIDELRDRSFYVDPETKEPATADVEGETVTDSFELERREDGTWVVVQSQRLS